MFVAHATAEGSTALDTRHNFTVIHNGLDRRRLVAAAAGLDRAAARRALGVEPDDIVLLLLGTVCERKGQHDLAQALALLPGAVASRVRTFFVGDRESEYQRTLHTMIGKLPDERRARVTIVPETGDVARYFVAADVFVCTSRVESYPRVILEAMAWGLPIVTTPVFGIREQVREDVNGLFYAPGDVDALAAAIARLVDRRRTARPARRQRRARARRAHRLRRDGRGLRPDLRRGGGALIRRSPARRRYLGGSEAGEPLPAAAIVLLTIVLLVRVLTVMESAARYTATCSAFAWPKIVLPDRVTSATSLSVVYGAGLRGSGISPS